MKRNHTLCVSVLLFAIIISIGSCTKTEPIPTQTVSYNLADFQPCLSYYGVQYTDTLIDSITAAGIQQAFINSGITYNISKVTSTKLNALTVNALSGGNFDFVSTIQVYLNAAGASGLGVEIANASNIATGTTTLALTMNGTELKGYLGTNDVVTILVKNKGASNGTCLDFTQGVMVSVVQQ
jgi:hypothetical protein